MWWTTRLTIRLSGALVGAAVLAGCAANADTGAPEPRPAGSCPAARPARDAGLTIDWAPFVVVDQVMFSPVHAPDGTLADEQVGDVVATVTCRIAGVVNDSDFRPRDGDAAFLPPGTKLHAVVGSPVTARLAAREEGVWRLYEAVEVIPTQDTGR
jgi:hypothetical protein